MKYLKNFFDGFFSWIHIFNNRSNLFLSHEEIEKLLNDSLECDGSEISKDEYKDLFKEV